MKTIIFDFDGTLTQKNQNIWKMLWERLGYKTDKTSVYAKLYVEHNIKHTISRGQWFNLTATAFKRKGMSVNILKEVSKNIHLIDGFNETILTLKKWGYSLHIVSGCLTQSIEQVLGEYKKHFTNIVSNNAIFDKMGNLKKLEDSKFDFQGKADYINLLKQTTNTKNEEIIFIGNGDNDEFAHLSGCKTLCINPDKTDSNNKTIWHKSIENVTNLTQILPYILSFEKEQTILNASLDKQF